MATRGKKNQGPASDGEALLRAAGISSSTTRDYAASRAVLGDHAQVAIHVLQAAFIGIV